jgi:hypothetical protein
MRRDRQIDDRQAQEQEKMQDQNGATRACVARTERSG